MRGVREGEFVGLVGLSDWTGMGHQNDAQTSQL